ncbi:MAG TPA: hypothetical protein PLN56_01875 [Methanoregulaceae archaeon]|nr:hypothetical protein [Methanoregulaceae archaeon]HPD09737.1 hypothetical protein [Methanoregulaceae archaeon]HRT14542.1 hypothetical protein [Methanoregulaceae archaeon]HRU30113.1 hypothetical protein [Methanoregulaceae archaeon]
MAPIDRTVRLVAGSQREKRIGPTTLPVSWRQSGERGSCASALCPPRGPNRILQRKFPIDGGCPVRIAVVCNPRACPCCPYREAPYKRRG